jgi:type IV secretory pathway VirD2 relaxase
MWSPDRRFASVFWHRFSRCWFSVMLLRENPRDRAETLSKDDDFEPFIGRVRSRGRTQKRFLHSVLAATNLAGGSDRTRRSGRFDGSRIGRGSGAGRMLTTRGARAMVYRRRVIIKSRIVRLAGKGMAGARAHIRYIERDGTTRDGGRGQLYGAECDHVDGKAFLGRAGDDRHQFRFIVSAEDAAEYEDLKPLTRRLMARVEEDLGTRLDWVAVDHFNTGHPHTHIIVRGKDDRGKDLVIAREYLSRGMRERAAELVDLDLGPRLARDVRASLRRDVEQERLTRIDRALLRDANAAGWLEAGGKDVFDRAIRIGRLRKLERLGLAAPAGRQHWQLAPDLEAALRQMGERGNIIRTMQRAFSARGEAPALADQLIYAPSAPGARPLVGRVIERGLADELEDHHYLIIEATDGRSHYVALGRVETVDAIADDAIVRITPETPRIREFDYTVARVAAANDGRYDVEAHLHYDPAASRAYAEMHVRRLEALRRRIGSAAREADGSWSIAPDHIERVAAYERAKVRDIPVRVDVLSPQPLGSLIGAHAATWLDRQLIAGVSDVERDAGFGHAVNDALERRRQWLIAAGLAEEIAGETIYRPDLLETLRRREILRVGSQLARELGLEFVEPGEGARISGVYRRSVETPGGRLAVIERARDFTLVPWRPVLERHMGKAVLGIERGDAIDWTIGRGRSGPEIS